MVACLPCINKALSSIPSTEGKKTLTCSAEDTCLMQKKPVKVEERETKKIGDI